MDNYGSRHQQVRAFIESLPSLTDESWRAATMNMVRTIPDLQQEIDTARFTLVVAQQENARLRVACTTAANAAEAAVRGLAWAAADPQVAVSARKAAQAIVALDVVDFEKVAVLFYPFWRTRVTVPVNGQQYTFEWTRRMAIAHSERRLVATLRSRWGQEPIRVTILERQADRTGGGRRQPVWTVQTPGSLYYDASLDELTDWEIQPRHPDINYQTPEE